MSSEVPAADDFNSIFSTDADLASLKGHHIEIRERTMIDSNCSISSYTYVGLNCFIIDSYLNGKKRLKQIII
jgi:acyl-[acyl carrier protein]--UDP-N-acetylglucosamine O-acyltransferase